MDFPSVRDFGRGDSRPRSILIEQRKIILVVFELAAFSPSQGQSRRIDRAPAVAACPLHLQ
jgi:hypothetical protein